MSFFSEFATMNDSSGMVFKLIVFIIMIIGAIECFAGYKVMKVMVSIAGFFIGSIIGCIVGLMVKKTILIIVLMILLGILVAVLSYKLYLLGVFFYAAISSSIIVLITYLSIKNFQSVSSVPIIISICIGVIIGIIAVCFVKPVVIFSTAFSGAGSIVSAICGLMNLTVSSHLIISIFLFVLFFGAGVFCQYKTTAKAKIEFSFSERKYPGMQHAYRNFCINCGCDIHENNVECPSCGFKLKGQKEED